MAWMPLRIAHERVRWREEEQVRRRLCAREMLASCTVAAALVGEPLAALSAALAALSAAS